MLALQGVSEGASSLVGDIRADATLAAIAQGGALATGSVLVRAYLSGVSQGFAIAEGSPALYAALKGATAGAASALGDLAVSGGVVLLGGWSHGIARAYARIDGRIYEFMLAIDGLTDVAVIDHSRQTRSLTSKRGCR